jgi:nickel transport protein
VVNLHPSLRQCGVLALLGALWLCPTPARAHKLNLFAHVEGKTILGKAYFSSGAAAQGVSVTAFDPAGRELGRTTADAQGQFSLEARTRCDHRLVVETADGHGAEYTVSAAELPADLAPAVAGPPKPGASGGSGGKIAAKTPPDADQIAAKIDALTAQVVQLREQLRFRDVLGGIGFILGITGIAFYCLGAMRNRHG